MGVTTAVFATYNYLIDTFRAASTLGAATPPVLIYDSVAVTQDYAGSSLWVGLSDPAITSDVLTVGASGDQSWAALGNRARYETFSVYCCAQGWDGGSDPRTARGVTATIMDAVETVVRNDISLGGNVLFVFPGVTGHVLRHANTSQGVYAPCSFRITCKARLVG